MRRILSSVVVGLFALASSACGGGGGGGGGGGLDNDPGNGIITITSFSPNPIIGCAPTPFTITGTGFESMVGSTANITFRAIGGITPFGHGTVDRATVVGLVTSDTTIDAISPQPLICGVPSISAEIDVELESGVETTSTGIFTVVINAPTLTSILPNPIPAAIPTPFTLTGTGFAPVGGPVTIRFTGDAGALLWEDGTENFTDVIGQIVSYTQITGITPIATVCDVASIGASLQLFFTDGCCTLPTASGFATFIAPTITSPATNPVPAAIATSLTINGANLGQVGNVGTIRFIADGGFNIFSDGTKNTIDVPAIITSPTTLSLVTPIATVCGVASRTSTLRYIAPYGSSCTTTGPAFLTFVAPTIASVNPNPVPSAIATLITITGTNFGPVGSPVIVRMTADAGRTLFDDGTANVIDVPGVIATATTVTLTTPLATVCNLVSAGTQVTVFAPSGNSCAISGTGFLTFNAPTLASTSLTPVPAAIPTAITLTGAGFGPVGSPATVTFLADGGANLFGNASHNAIDVPGIVATATTITVTTPAAAVCPGTSAGAAVRITLQNGSCVTSAAAFQSFAAPTVTTVTGTPVPASIPTTVTVNGSGFFPTGGLASVTFITDGTPPIFGDGTLAQVTVVGTITGPGTITVVTPHATVAGPGNRTATIRVTLPSGACGTSGAAVITFNGPTIASVTTPLQAANVLANAFTVVGTNFGPVGSEAIVRFIADGGATPFGNADQNTIDIPGVVTGSTTITGTAPLAAVCPGLSQSFAVRVTLQDGSSVQSAPGLGTYNAPVATSFTFVPTPWSSGIVSTFTLTGTNFGPVGSLAKITFTAAGGATPFGGGTLNEAEITASVTSTTTVTGQTPMAIVCGPGAVTVNARIWFSGGACDDVATATVIAVPTAGAGAFAPVSVPALTPTAFTITGTGFQPIGGQATVVFTATAGNPFENGNAAETTVTGTIASATSITGLTPIVAACPANVVANVGLRFNGADCPLPIPAGTVTFLAPTVTTITTPAVAAFTPTAATITGTNFGPAAGPQVMVRWTSTLPIFADGTSTTFDGVGTLAGTTTLTTTIPATRVCGAASATAVARVIWPSGSCADSPAAFVTFTAPAAASFLPVTASAETPTLVTITGTNYAPVGGLVTVRFVAAAGTPFAGGTASEITATGTVASTTSVTVNSPVAVLCGTASVTATLSMIFADSPCSTTVPGTLTLNGPTLGPVVPTPVVALTATAISMAGTNLPAAGTPVILTYTATTPIFAGGTALSIDLPGTVGVGTVTSTTPIATICGAASAAATILAQFPDGSCTTVTGGITFNGPTAASFAAVPVTVSSEAPSVITITGTNFAPIGAPVAVRFLAGAGTPFSGGTANEVTLTGTIATATTITVNSPLAQVCPAANVTATLSAILNGGPCSLAIPGTLTINAPTETAVAPLTVQSLTPTLVTLTGANFPAIGTPVVVTFIGVNPIFADGTSTFIDVAGVVATATTITTIAPAATICGTTTSTANMRVTFPSGSCVVNGAVVLTYNAPQIGATSAGFTPQNLNMDAPTAFTITAGGTTTFSPVGGMVDVRFTATAGTPFSGGTSAFATVSGQITSATTIVGSSPVPSSVPNTFNVNVRVFFEDGTCTNDGTAAYLRAANVFAVVGTSNLYLFNSATNAVLTGSPILIPGMASNAGGVAIDRAHNRAYVVNASTAVVRIVDLIGGTTAGTGTPTLLTTSIAVGAAPTRAVWDSVHGRIYLVAGGGVQYIDTNTNGVSTLPWGLATPLTLHIDNVAKRILTDNGTLELTATSTDTNVMAISQFVQAIGTAAWTGGFATAPAAGRTYLTFDDPTGGNTDRVIAVGVSLDTTAPDWTFTTAADANPTRVIGTDDTWTRVLYRRSGGAFNDVESIHTGLATSSGSFAAPDASFIKGSFQFQRAFISSSVNNNVVVGNTQLTTTVTTLAGVTGANGSDGAGN